MSSIFTPPTIADVPSVSTETPRQDRRFWSRFGPYPRGRSVVKVSGTYATVDYPSQDQLTGLVEGVDYFLGGHVYVVTDAVAAALTASGYGSAVNTVQWSELTGSWALYSSDPWGTIG